MPELPEVETTRLGVLPWLQGACIREVRVRQPRLRWPVPEQVRMLANVMVGAVRRRGKFLLIDTSGGQLLIHLGMSGSLRVLAEGTPPGKHDHVDLVLGSGMLIRLNDPRRFGAVLWSEGTDSHPLLAHLGPEPLEAQFDGRWLAQRAAGRRQSVKAFIMDNRTVVGVGNIYAQESLFRAGIHPSRQAGRVSAARYERLAQTIKEVLSQAIEAGGTTLRDFTRADGQPGYFAQTLSVYGRAGEPCRVCGSVLRGTRHGQRATCHCPQCQR
jgi:formamidopyrimidine-DNA glycosylase